MSVIISGFCFFFPQEFGSIGEKGERGILGLPGPRVWTWSLISLCLSSHLTHFLFFNEMYLSFFFIFFFFFWSLDFIIWWAKLLLFLFSTFWQAHLSTYPTLLTGWLPWIRDDVTATPRWLPSLPGLLTFVYSFLLSWIMVHMLSWLYSFILQGSVSKKYNRNGREPGVIFTGHKEVWELLEHSE